MGKPVHPATVHFPLAFLILSYGLDIVHTWRASLPSTLASALLSPNDMTRASYYLLSMGLLSAIPAVVTGGREFIMMLKKQGMYEADGKTVRTKVKATIAHALANDVVLAISTYIWYTRRSQVKDTLAGKVPGSAAAAYAPSSAIVFAEGAIMALLVFAANIGGTLTYNYGVGFSSLGAANKEVNRRVGTYADDPKDRIQKAHAAFNTHVPNGTKGEGALSGDGNKITK